MNAPEISRKSLNQDNQASKQQETTPIIDTPVHAHHDRDRFAKIVSFLRVSSSNKAAL
jgi:hypothetical protein